MPSIARLAFVRGLTILPQWALASDDFTLTTSTNLCRRA
jgi:hypothetical protein